MVGDAKLHNAGYRDEYVRLHDINGGAQLHVTPTELLLTALTGYLPGGGSAAGELRIANWLGEVPAQTCEYFADDGRCGKDGKHGGEGRWSEAPPVQSLTITAGPARPRGAERDGGQDPAAHDHGRLPRRSTTAILASTRR